MVFFQAKKSGRYDQGILDVGLTAEDKVELVKTHTFMRKHATGKCKIELHVLHVERGDFYFSFFFSSFIKVILSFGRNDNHSILDQYAVQKRNFLVLFFPSNS